MGSNDTLLSSDDPALVLATPTPEERRQVWVQTHAMWGTALTLDDYVDREAYLTTVPVARDSGISHWILTDGRQAANARPILSSCESLRKHAMAAFGSSTDASLGVVDGAAHGIASVFTDPQYRGQGYAGRMLRELGKRLSTWQVEVSPWTPPTALFSVLFSDIGKSFYASKGWKPFPSTHLSFAPAADAPTGTGADRGYTVTPLGYHELTELCPVDVQLLRARLARRATRLQNQAPPHGTRVSVALVPDLDTMLWHLMREDYMTKHIFGKTPTVRGALCTLPPPSSSGDGSSGRPRRSMWVVWTRGYYGGIQTTQGNTLHILRVALEDLDDDFPEDPDEVPISQAHVDGFAAIVRLAQAEAAAWHCGDVQMWNPTAAQRILADRSGIGYREVEREKESIASLMWHGGENGEGKDVTTETVDWVGNEKYGWC